MDFISTAVSMIPGAQNRNDDGMIYIRDVCSPSKPCSPSLQLLDGNLESMKWGAGNCYSQGKVQREVREAKLLDLE